MKISSDRLYQIPVPIIALTGGIACGKSTVAKLFKDKNIPLISADELVKEIYLEDEALKFIQGLLPAAIENSKINFSVLRQIVFSKPDIKQKVEDFIYQRLPQKFLNAFIQFSAPRILIYDVPLLFEKKLDTKVDKIICVYCPRSEQIKRLLKRDNITLDLAENMLKQQIDIEIKKNAADYVINNTQDLAFLEKEFQETFEQIKSL